MHRQTNKRRLSRAGKPSRIRPLVMALSYDNDMIVYKFVENYDLPFEEARDLFQQTKKWLWLVATCREEMAEASTESVHLAIDGPLTLLDEMWHTFILFTLEYTEYCLEHFGFYIHHSPTTKAEKDSYQRGLKDHREKTVAEREAQMRTQYNYIYDHLGEETLVKWYSDYADRYTPEFINSIYRGVGARTT